MDSTQRRRWPERENQTQADESLGARFAVNNRLPRVGFRLGMRWLAGSAATASCASSRHSWRHRAVSNRRRGRQSVIPAPIA